MSGNAPRRPEAVEPEAAQLTVSLPPSDSETGPGASSDAEIVAAISAVLYEPFAEVWRRYQHDAWLPLRRTLEAAVATHERALTDVSRGRYERAVAEDIIAPLRAALSGSTAAASLEASLASTADRARASLARLPPSLEAPLARPLGAQRVSGAPIRAIKRAFARVPGALRPSGRVRSVPVARLARQHLDQVVLRAQARAFRASQRDRAAWLGRLERAFADWIALVIEHPHDASSEGADAPADRPSRHLAAAAALQSELEALATEVTRAPGRERGDDFTHALESLRGSVAVAGTLAADPPSSRPLPGREQELARRWDHRADGTAARLELYRSLLVLRDGARRDFARSARRLGRNGAGDRLGSGRDRSRTGTRPRAGGDPALR